MKRILSYFKKHIPALVILVIVLSLQVQCELLLPQYTSEIVNIGIQQGGIEYSIPKIIDENTYGMLLSMSDKEDRVKIAKSYELDKASSNNPNKKLIPKESKGDYYILKKRVDKKTLEKYTVDPLVKLAEYRMPKKFKGKAMPDFVKKQVSIKMVENIYKTNKVDLSKIQTNYLWKTGIRMLSIALLVGGFSILVSFIGARISSKVGRKLRTDTYASVLNFSNYEMDKFSIASLIARCTNDIQQIQRSSMIGLKFVFYGPIMAVCAFFKVFRLDISMVWIIFLAIVVTILSIVLIMKKAIPRFKLIQGLIDRLNLVTREFISGIEVNRVFGTSKYEEERFDKVNRDLTENSLTNARILAFLEPIMILVMNIATLMIVWFGAKNIEAGNIQVGDMMAFIQYAIQIIFAFLFIAMMSIILPRAIISANRVEEVIFSEVSIKDEGRIFEFDEEGSLVFDKVSFKYDGATEEVLKDISFEIKKGRTTAIIGSTGSGKSTIVNLIPRFLEPCSGKIELNGVDIKDIPMKVLRKKIAIVPQKPVVFSGTIASNIQYSKSILRVKEMAEAARISQALEFIKEKEAMFDSEVAQGGSNLSGGQKQRLSIARAIDRDAEILVFDDSFSALDATTDKKLRQAIRMSLRNKSLLIISQKINTIRKADEILVLEAGKIVGRGKHEDLVKNCEVYYEIAKSQLTEGELKDEDR